MTGMWMEAAISKFNILYFVFTWEAEEDRKKPNDILLPNPVPQIYDAGANHYIS
jgi:hypothetical protein